MTKVFVCGNGKFSSDCKVSCHLSNLRQWSIYILQTFSVETLPHVLVLPWALMADHQWLKSAECSVSFKVFIVASVQVIVFSWYCESVIPYGSCSLFLLIQTFLFPCLSCFHDSEWASVMSPCHYCEGAVSHNSHPSCLPRQYVLSHSLQ
jgi:hypothetical protein